MKKILFFLVAMLPLIAIAQTDLKDDESGEKILIGEIQRPQLEEALGQKFHEEYDGYQSNVQMLQPFEDRIRQMNITIVMGTWCSDSKREVPRFLRIFDELGFEQGKLTIICVDKNKKANDLNVKEKYGVELVPTFIFYQDDVEVGRITEKPVKTLESDIVEMLQKEKVMDFEHQKYLNNPSDSKMKLNEGIEQPSQVNDEAVQRFKSLKNKKITPDNFVEGILNRDITILSKAITLIESSLPEHHQHAQEIIEKCLPYSGKSLRIGITGVPGVGKSSFIEVFGKYLTGLGKRLAVLAIDPSSERSKGSILGDKTRMEQLSSDSNAFIRPSPSAGSLGGVARKTRETIILCEAAGFDVIFVETVGVGQSEVAVHSMVDFFLLLMLAGAGDELQGIKRGIIEMSDAIFINKADGENILNAQRAKVEYKNALHLFPPSESGWIPETGTCSARTKEGIEQVWEMITRYESFTRKNGFFEKKRLFQEKQRMFETINESLKDNFYQNIEIQNCIAEIEQKVLNNQLSSYLAAGKLLEIYLKGMK